MSIRRRHATAAVVAALLLPAAPAHAQGWLKKVREAATQAAGDAAQRKTANAARNGTEKAIDAAGAAVLGKDSAKTAAPTAAPPKAAKAAAAGAAAAAPNADAFGAPAAAWANYDFTPGTRPLYVDDFTADNVGDFPKRLTWKQGNAEVVEWQGGRWLRATSFGTFAIPLPEVLPERFTLEFEMVAPSGWSQTVTFGPEARGNQPQVSLGPDRGGVVIDGVHTESAPDAGGRGSYGKQAFPVRLQADGRHVKVYMGETRVANVPQVDLGRDRRVRFDVSASAEAPVFIGRVRLMAGGKALYDALAASGRVATQGIYFATASDAPRPESAPTLKEIAAMLAQHPDLKLTIEGHTDDVGDAAANQALSARRAAAVKQALVAQYGADAARLDARGLGATKPVAPNGTSEGRQANRRVELVRR